MGGDDEDKMMVMKIGQCAVVHEDEGRQKVQFQKYMIPDFHILFDGAPPGILWLLRDEWQINAGIRLMLQSVLCLRQFSILEPSIAAIWQ